MHYWNFLCSWEIFCRFFLYSSYVRPICVLYKSYINPLEVVGNSRVGGGEFWALGMVWDMGLLVIFYIVGFLRASKVCVRVCAKDLQNSQERSTFVTNKYAPSGVVCACGYFTR